MNRLSVWGKGEKIARRAKGIPLLAIFFIPVQKQRACSQAMIPETQEVMKVINFVTNLRASSFVHSQKRMKNYGDGSFRELNKIPLV